MYKYRSIRRHTELHNYQNYRVHKHTYQISFEVGLRLLVYYLSIAVNQTYMTANLILAHREKVETTLRFLC